MIYFHLIIFVKNHLMNRAFKRLLKNKISLAIIIVCVASTVISQENSEESQKQVSTITFGSKIDFPSRYIWHGLPWSKSTVMQPYFWASARGFTFTIFSNFDLDHQSNKSAYNESDFTIAYRRVWKKIIFEPDFQYYLYPNPNSAFSTGEGVLKFLYPLGSMNIVTVHTFDMFRFKGSYFGELGIVYASVLNKVLSLELCLLSGWASSKFNKVYIGLKRNAFNILDGDFSFIYYPQKQLYIRPRIGISYIVDNHLHNYLSDPSIIRYGLGFGVQF